MKIRTFAVICCALALFGCGSSPKYVANSTSMNVQQAQDTLKRMLPQRYTWVFGQGILDNSYLITDVRIRRDGVGFLWVKGRDPGLLASRLAWDNPANVKICYFSQVPDNPTVFYDTFGSMKYVQRLCDLVLPFDTLSEARAFADALYVLKRNAN